MAEGNGAFGSPKELADLLEDIGVRLHGKNRIAGGESNYLWHLAEVIRGAGRLAARFDDDPDVRAMFGDAYNSGTVPFEDQRERFFLLLSEACATA